MFNQFTVSSKVKGSYKVSFTDDFILPLLNAPANTIIVADRKVAQLYPEDFQKLSKIRSCLIDCSEDAKTIDYCKQVIAELLDLRVRKNDVLIAIGGGITQDIVAFISSVLFRGLDWWFVPTTLLAQCDSCIGSKSSINFEGYKNLLGSFNPPNEIFIDIKFLLSLTESEIKSGIGEMLHYFLTDGTEVAEELMSLYESLLVDRHSILPFINKSLAIKKRTIEKDEFDTDLRHIFNYGHTFGHALESITHYAIPHGQAVTLGMDLANYVALRNGMIEQQTFDKLHSILQKNIPVFRFNAENISSYVAALSKDKKNKGTMLGCILPYSAGSVKKVFIELTASFSQIILDYSESIK